MASKPWEAGGHLAQMLPCGVREPVLLTSGPQPSSLQTVDAWPPPRLFKPPIPGTWL